MYIDRPMFEILWFSFGLPASLGFPFITTRNYNSSKDTDYAMLSSTRMGNDFASRIFILLTL
jgi:hypothetical protein